MSDASEAIQDIAITTGKGIEAAQTFGSFIARFISGPLEQGVGIFEDKLCYMRWERQLRLIKRSKEVMNEIGITQPTRPLPLKLAIPLFQGASLEDDNYLQDRWVYLLVNAVNEQSGTDLKRAYIDILESIDSFEARILEKIYSIPFEETQHVGVLTYALPDEVYKGIEEGDLSRNENPPSPEVAMALANLARLGCVRFRMTWGGGEVFSWVNPTLLGKSFVRACTL
jgi:hypothetical protein